MADGGTTRGAHAEHDPELVAATLDVDLDPGTRLAADALVASCPDCARLRDDLLALSVALRAQPVPPRPRDFRLGAADEARLRPATGEPHPSPARLTGDMTDPRAASAHAAHDTMLLAALADDVPTGAERAAAQALVDGCGLCAAIATDLVALRLATRSMPTPPRPRDYHLSAADAVRLRPAGWRRWVAAFGSPRDLVSRPLAIGLTTLGLAGLLVAGGPSILQGGTTSSGASVDTTAKASQQVIAAPELANPGTDAAAGAGFGSAPPGVAAANPSTRVVGDHLSSGSPLTDNGGSRDGEPITSIAPLAGGVKPAGVDASGSGAGVTNDVTATGLEGRPSTESASGGPGLLAVSGVLLLIGLGLFGLRWTARRYGV